MWRESNKNSSNQTKINTTMKTKSLIIIAASLGLIGAAFAQDGPKKGGDHKMPPEVIARFDTDGDGKLNETEREAAKAEHKEMMETRKKEMMEKFDTDKDGKLSDDEKAAMKAEREKMMLEKFDKDGDGKLSDAEKATMREEMKNRPGGPKGPRGKGGERKGKKGPGAPKKDAE